jgi:CRISPR system Cascade subunit CasB
MSHLLDQLRWYKKKDDRGIMAALRCVLVENKKHRAWPALHRLGVKVTDFDSALIAGLFAMHWDETARGNFGDTCLAIEKKRLESRGKDNKLTPTERRFQHLLISEKSELHGRLMRMVRLAKSNDIPVNYEKLKYDLKYWNDRTKVEWADAFWGQETS